MPKSKPTLGYASQKEAREAIRVILNGATIGQPLPSHFELLERLVERHRDRDQKVGAGIEHFYVEVSPHPHQHTRCFHICRTDGTHTDFSFEKCLRPPSLRQTWSDAARQVVSMRMPDVLIGRDELDPALSNRYHLRHRPSWAGIVESFLERTGRTPENRDILSATDNRYGAEFSDDGLKTEFWDAYLRAYNLGEFWIEISYS